MPRRSSPPTSCVGRCRRRRAAGFSTYPPPRDTRYATGCAEAKARAEAEAEASPSIGGGEEHDGSGLALRCFVPARPREGTAAKATPHTVCES